MVYYLFNLLARKLTQRDEMSSQDHAISLRVTKIKIHGSDLNFHRGKYIFTAIVDKKRN